jgi:hypothetical protein
VRHIATRTQRCDGATRTRIARRDANAIRERRSRVATSRRVRARRGATRRDARKIIQSVDVDAMTAARRRRRRRRDDDERRGLTMMDAALRTRRAGATRTNNRDVDDDARARDAIGDARDDARTRGETTRRCGQSGGRRRERVETDGGDETELGE